MSMNVKLAAAIIGGSALAGIVALCAGLDPDSSDTTSADSTIVSFTAPPSTPTVAVAVPGITGPAPMWAGEAPNANPQAGHSGVG